MMSYCTPADVRRVINTTLADGDITELISETDAWIEKKLGTQSLSDKLIRRLSALKTAIIIRSRDPQSFAIGEYSETAGTFTVQQVWKQEIDEILKLYTKISFIKSTGYATDEIKNTWDED
ncbi:hypothetical protein KEJ39_09225 [Candidatus Bathyarchaeota archaeon]|nr:hypothetical protein [Candidatus Bathyarchaeota archaeon]